MYGNLSHCLGSYQGAVADELRVSKKLGTRAELVRQVYSQYLQTYEEEQRTRTEEDKKELAALAGEIY